MWVVGYHLTYGINYTHLMSRTDNHFLNKTKKPTPTTIVLLFHDDKCKRYQLTVCIDPNCNEHCTFIVPSQERAINRQHITTMLECFNALSKYPECTKKYYLPSGPITLGFGMYLKCIPGFFAFIHITWLANTHKLRPNHHRWALGHASLPAMPYHTSHSISMPPSPLQSMSWLSLVDNS
jgi:hypothetical protein